MTDALIIGGGVIGLSIARELATASLDVTLVDSGVPGREASWAGAGILPPTFPGNPDVPMVPLTLASHALWPSLSEELLQTTGIDNGFRQCGGIQLAQSTTSVPAISLSPETEDSASIWQQAGAIAESISADELRLAEPNLSPSIASAIRLPEVWQVRNPRHLKAMQQRCEQLGVRIVPGTEVRTFNSVDGRVQSVTTSTQQLSADHFIVCAGAWTGKLLEQCGHSLNIRPIRGQIVQLQMDAPPLTHVIECGSRYLVPRNDGLVLIGATEEAVGFEKQNTHEAVEGLREFAYELVPVLREARIVRAWSGLRPYRPSGRPIISVVPGLDNLFVAAGHFRAGLHLSPITGRLVKQLVLGETLDVSLEAFTMA